MQKLEKFLTVLVVMSYGGTVLPALIANGALPTGPLDVESPGVMIIFAVTYLVILFLLMLRQGIIWRVPTVNPVLTALIILAFVSAAWSVFPDVTLRRSVALTFTTLFGLYLALRWRLDEAVALLATGLGMLILLSFVFVAALPQIGVDQDIHRGAWKGVFFQKNVTGRMIVWFSLSVLWLDWMGCRPKWLLRGSFLAAFVLLVMSRSGTGLLSTIMVAVVMLSVRLLRVNIRTLIPALAFLGLGAVVATTLISADFREAMYMLGRDATLTGRTELWRFAREMLQDNFVLGYGYAAFWYGLYGPASYYTTGWGITSVHNGWLEVLLDAGLPGLIMMIYLMGRLLFGGVLVARYVDWREAPWILAVALGLLAVSISESVFLERHSLNWVVFVLGVTRVIILRRRAKAPASSPGPAPQATPAYAGAGGLGYAPTR
ncbi:O-antigen ligase family protein [Azospirillum sp.]|uniref:O-antigen ligase family protein n=1 Tax=Azospirillum sp. TaxID=34012 RepID=UPI003D723680